jgi:hypothetical protein
LIKSPTFYFIISITLKDKGEAWGVQVYLLRRDERDEDQRAEGKSFVIAHFSFRFGHYAALSFVARGKGIKNGNTSFDMESCQEVY